MKRRMFRVAWPPNQDVAIFVLTEYEYYLDEQGEIDQDRPQISRVLTEDGWKVFQSYEVMPPNMPHIDGIDMARQGTMKRELDKFIQQLNDLISPATPVAAPVQGTDQQGREGNVR